MIKVSTVSATTILINDDLYFFFIKINQDRHDLTIMRFNKSGDIDQVGLDGLKCFGFDSRIAVYNRCKYVIFQNITDDHFPVFVCKASGRRRVK